MGVGEGDGDGDAAASGAAPMAETPSTDGVGDWFGVGVGSTGKALGEGMGEGEGLVSWARPVFAATRHRTPRTRATTIQGKGNTRVGPS